MINYKVKEKDTLKDISKKFYKDPSKDFLIAYFNNLKTGSELVSGTILELPILGSEFTRPTIDIRIELIKAENFLKEKRYRDVLDIAGKILEYDRLNKKASDLKNVSCYQIGMELSRQEKYPEAIEMFKKVTPEYQGVEEAIQQAINKELFKAKNLLKQKQYEQVFAVTKKILDYDKSNKAAQDLINTAFCQQAKYLTIRKNYTQALNVLNRADPQYDCVKKTISDVYKAKKKQAEVHYLNGVKHFLNEELQSAIKEWEKTLALNPEHKKAKKNINNARSLLEKLEKSPEIEIAIIATEEVFKTYEIICLDKLKEIGRSTARDWSFAMGYNHRSSLAKIIRRIKERYPEKLKIYEDRYPRLYEAM